MKKVIFFLLLSILLLPRTIFILNTEEKTYIVLDKDAYVTREGEIELKAFNEESSLILKPVIGLSYTENSLTNEGISLKSDNYELNFYKISNGYEYEIIFYSNPLINEIIIPIDLTNFVLYYQPPLYEEYIESYDLKQIDFLNSTHAIFNKTVIDYRPLNVVGSYAVYHSSKRGNEYTTGKAYHLFTNQFIDAKGNTVYVPYNSNAQETKQLVVEIPKEFMDKAVYPVTFAPTFGKTDIGGSEWSKSIDRQIACKYSLTETGIIESVSAYIGCTPTGNVRGGLYDDSGSNTPLNLEAYSDGHSIDVSFEWELFTFLSTVQEDASSYWLAVQNQQPIGFKYDSGASGQTNYYYSPYADGFDSVWGSGTGEARALSIYATYELPEEEEEETTYTESQLIAYALVIAIVICIFCFLIIEEK